MIPMSENDPMTGLPRRAQCLKHFEDLVELQVPFGMILLDIDNFILINDRDGHDVGDQKLKKLASFILRMIPPEASVFRYGGDDFMVFLSGLPMAQVVSVAMQIRNTVSQEFADFPALTNSYSFPDRSRLAIQSPFAVSCGIAFYPLHGKRFEDLWKAADRAMYLAGKNLNPSGVLAVADMFDLERLLPLMTREDVKYVVLRAIMRNNGYWNYYQLDRELSGRYVDCIGPFFDEIDQLTKDGLIELKPNPNLDDHLRYWVTEKVVNRS
jgi:diguanylate cyclase (GGDEF)-like protein